ncbi:hypothetical protein HK096_006090, partial [Nowakowskiella sp. JEL0078]
MDAPAWLKDQVTTTNGTLNRAFILEEQKGRISLIFRFSKRDTGETALVSLRYNFKTKVIAFWEPPNQTDTDWTDTSTLSTLMLDEMKKRQLVIPGANDKRAQWKCRLLKASCQRQDAIL